MPENNKQISNFIKKSTTPEVIIVIGIIAMITSLILPSLVTQDMIEKEKIIEQEIMLDLTPEERAERVSYKYYIKQGKYVSSTKGMTFEEWKILKELGELPR